MKELLSLNFSFRIRSVELIVFLLYLLQTAIVGLLLFVFVSTVFTKNKSVTQGSTSIVMEIMNEW